MSYGVYSEVYLAIDMDYWKKEENIMVKVGESTNSRRRSKQLERDKYITVVSDYEIGGTEVYRKWVEGCLRLYIEKTFDCYQVGTDTFVFRKKQEVKEIQMLFTTLVTQIINTKMF